LLVDRPKLVAFGPVAADVEFEHKAVRGLVRSLCVAQAVRHVDPASREALYAARMHLAIAGIAAHRKDLHESGHCFAVVVVEHVDSAERTRDAASRAGEPVDIR